MPAQPNSDALKALQSKGLITPADIVEAERLAAVNNANPIQILLQQGKVTQTQLIQVAAEGAGLEFVELTEFPVDIGTLARLDGATARRLNVLPLDWKTPSGAMRVAVSISQASDLEIKDDLRRLTRGKVEFVVALKSDITAKINQVYRAEAEMAELTADMAADDPAADDFNAPVDATEEAPIVKFVNLLISQAITDRASDIHIEPGEHELRVRYRIDGVLKAAHTAPRTLQGGVISRLKIMSDINIAERRLPQDGRLSINHQGKKVDLRVSSLPTVWGEKVVMRILDNSNTRMELTDLGFSEANYSVFEQSFTKPYGMILVTGPTGSGKSTTLYATLNIVAKPTVNVITVEDPVEYRLPGINQVQVNHKAGLDFAKALRSILRQDPDIVLVGEIRDHETAQIAMEAALTGHLVLSTLHTNDAPSAITRLIEMDVEPFLVGSAIDSVLAQRLCRRLCTKCKEPYIPTEAELQRVRYPWVPGEPLPTLYKAVGCTHCSRTGYRGRMALHEVMAMTEEIEKLAVARASADEIMRVAVANGMKTLRDDGWLKVGLGHTTIEEILRVVV